MSTTKENSGNAINAKQFGRNIILVIDGEKHSKAFENKEDRDKILSDVDAYNKKPSKTKLSSILKRMSKEDKPINVTLKKIEKKSKPSKTKEKLKNEEILKAQELLKNEGFIVTKEAPKPRRGEY